MKERPILFSAPMVRALLDGSKTQTRRAVALPRTRDSFVLEDHGTGWWPYQSDDGETSNCNDGMEHPYDCPYGRPGDRLWVRETFAEEYDYCDHPEMPGAPTEHFHLAWHYRADGEPSRTDLEGFLSGWKPSIHMFRRASRITLEITDVRVERLQDISRGDAMDEGCPFPNMAKGDDPRKWYAELWGQINGAGAWDANPWVWAISFKKVSS